MSFKIFHQCGHNANWNRNSFTNHGNGAGLIFSPVHERMTQIESYDSDLKLASFFDPQFYLPNSQKTKLKEYPFFPESLAQGFQTSNFEVLALDAARLCIQFQVEQDFERLIIPARFFEQMVTNYCESQDAYSVIPHLAAIEEFGNPSKKVYVTLPVTNHMISDEGYRTAILNWITGYPEIDGIYLIVSSQRTRKQICDTDTIYNNLVFVRELRESGLEVLMGYCNSESLLYSVVNDAQVTFGAYENTRLFSIDKFIVSEDDQRGPRPRIYLQGLHNWVQLDQAREIRDASTELWELIYEPTEESEEALNSVGPWHFGKSNLYMHHFSNLQSLVSELDTMEPSGAHSFLRDRMRLARDYYIAIDDVMVDLEQHGNGDHLSPWLAAINKYARNFLAS